MTLSRLVNPSRLRFFSNSLYASGSHYFSFPVARYGTESVDECWKCHRHVSRSTQFFCPKCSSVQPYQRRGHDDPDYYKIFDVEPRPQFSLDLKKLDQRYKFLMSKLHPDKFAMKSDEERRYSADQSALLTRAYHTLKDPKRRAKYLMQYLNRDLDATALPDEFLMEMMELMEQASDETDRDKLGSIASRTHSQMEELGVSIQDALAKEDYSSLDRLVAQLNYICRIHDTVDEKL